MKGIHLLPYLGAIWLLFESVEPSLVETWNRHHITLQEKASWSAKEFLNTLQNWLLWKQWTTYLNLVMQPQYDRGRKFNRTFWTLLKVSSLCLQSCVLWFPWDIQSVLSSLKSAFFQASWPQISLCLHYLTLAAICLDDKSGSVLDTRDLIWKVVTML